MMDPEPGRCRRTDGKRWRCSRSVIAEQKYCERHIHRGRQRSRQLVGNNPKFDVPIDNTRNSLPSMNSTDTTNSNHKTNISTKIDSQLASPTSPKTRHGAPTAVNISSTSSTSVTKASNDSSINLFGTPTIIMSYNSKSEGNGNSRVDSRCMVSTSVKAGVANNSKCRHRSNDIDGKDAGLNHNKVRESSRSNCGKEGCFSGFSGAAYGLSPKSVLQGGIDASCRSLGIDCKGVMTDIQRCRRTDGKKWQCSRAVIHGQKYCEKHMHRGVKRVAAVSSMAAVSPAAAASTSSNSPFFVAKRVDNRIKPNADPCPLIAACTLQTNGDGSSTSSSSSDATTITD